jgi:hypothetical protein
MSEDFLPALSPARAAWNKGRIIGQKRPHLPRFRSPPRTSAPHEAAKSPITLRTECFWLLLKQRCILCGATREQRDVQCGAKFEH